MCVSLTPLDMTVPRYMFTLPLRVRRDDDGDEGANKKRAFHHLNRHVGRVDHPSHFLWNDILLDGVGASERKHADNECDGSMIKIAWRMRIVCGNRAEVRTREFVWKGENGTE